MFFYVIIYILLNILITINCKNEYIPVLLWTSSKMPKGPTLNLNKINCELFSSYLSQKISDKKPLVVVFMEQNLSIDDFNWQDKNGQGVFPFLSNLQERMNFFPYVENPYESFKKMNNNGYTWKCMQSDWNWENGSAIIVKEFGDINIKNRKDTLKSHDDVMAKVTNDLKTSGREWICIYTARYSRSLETNILKELSTWHVNPEPGKVLHKPLNIYKDEVHKLAFLTRGPIQLYLPTHRNHTVKCLEDYMGISVTRFEDTMDFIIWFTQKYTLTFCMSLLSNEWVIKSVNIQNENGQTMKLWPKAAQSPGKCYTGHCEFVSKGKPVVKLELSKYKVVHLSEIEATCVDQYTVPFLCITIFTSVAFVGLLWSMILNVYKIPVQNFVKRIPISFQLSRKSPLNSNLRS